MKGKGNSLDPTEVLLKKVDKKNEKAICVCPQMKKSKKIKMPLWWKISCGVGWKNEWYVTSSEWTYEHG